MCHSNIYEDRGDTKGTVASLPAPGLPGHCRPARFSPADVMIAVGELGAYAPGLLPLLPGALPIRKPDPAPRLSLVPRSFGEHGACLKGGRQTDYCPITFILSSVPSKSPSPFLSAAVPDAASQALTLWLRFLLSADLPDGS